MQLTTLPAPAANSLADAYLNRFESVADWFRYHPANDFAAAIGKARANHPDRQALADLLLEQNNTWNASAKTHANIAALRQDGSFAIVTGQQAGVLGGPLYTLYKTITVLKLCEKLQREFPQHAFVPVFWLEVNDSDFAEISSIAYADKDNNLRQPALAESQEEVLKPVNSRQIDPALRDWRQQIDRDFFDSEFKQEALDQFFNVYQSGSYTDAFAALLVSLFGEQGLVLINPAADNIAGLASALYQRAIAENDTLLELLQRRSQVIEAAGYSPQIGLRANQTLLFLQDSQGRRLRLDRAGNSGFTCRLPDGSDRPVAPEELADTRRLSPNVALRPLLQDTLLPTLVYVAGPGEIAYFAQIEVLYSYFGIAMPLIYPRHRVTILENKVQRLCAKLDIPPAQVLSGADLAGGIVEKNGAELLQALQQSEDAVRDILQQLQHKAVASDATLESAFEKTIQGIGGNLGKLSGRVRQSVEQRSSVQLQQLERILTHLLPAGKPQERVFSPLYFFIKYGPGFLRQLYDTLPEDTREHYLLEL